MIFQEIEGISPKYSKSILTETKGSLEEFTHSLNPYSGCLFDCSYCYVPKGFKLAMGEWAKEHWGKWVEPKLNAPLLLKRQLQSLKSRYSNFSIFMGSVTDPYQPVEKKYKITREILKVLQNFPIVSLVIQTRSPLIIRDINLIKKLNTNLKGKLFVNMSITSNDESVRKIYEPKTASYHSRMLVLQKLTEADIQTRATITPLLPCNPEKFASQISKVTKTISIGPIKDDSTIKVPSVNNYIGASTRDRFYQVLPSKDKLFFSSEFYTSTVKIFKEILGEKNVFDWENIDAKRKEEKRIKKSEQRVSLLNYI